jgi:hypothetical protein
VRRPRGIRVGLGLTLLAATAVWYPSPAVALPPPDGSVGLVLQAPFDSCTTKTVHSNAAKPGDWKVVTKGFSAATASCDAATGSFSYRPVVFGGTEGGVNVASKPTQTADASGAIVARFVASTPGNWDISVALDVSGRAGAGAGSGMAASINAGDELGKSLLDYFTGTQISKVLGLLGASLAPTAAKSRTDAYLEVSGAGKGSDSIQLTGVIASFPIVGPWLDAQTYDNEHIQLHTTIRVVRPGVIMVKVGLKSHAEAWGYADAFTKIDRTTVDWIEVTPPNQEPPLAPTGLTETWTDWAACSGGPDWSGASTAINDYGGICYTATYHWNAVAKADLYRVYGAFMEPGYYTCDDLPRQLITSLPATMTTIDLYVADERSCFYIAAVNSFAESDVVKLPRRPSS